MDIKRYNQHTRGQIRPQPRSVVVTQKSKTVFPTAIYDPAKNTITIVNNAVTSGVNHKLMQPVLPPTPPKKKIGGVVSTEVRGQHISKALARTTNKAMLLSRAVSNKTKKKHIKHNSGGLLIRRIVLGLCIALLLGSTGYVSFSTWQTNTKAKQIMKTIETPVSDDVQEEVKAALPQGVETKVPVASALDSYKVSSELPKVIYINKINVTAKIMPMSVNSDNSMQAPTNIYDAGWYTSSAKPGQDGAMLIDGHASESGTHYGLFGYLANIKNGDEIIIERGDGVKFTYKVAEVRTEPLEGLDMSKMLVPYGDAKQGVNLIACAGEWTSDKSTLDHRLLVFAVLKN